MKQACCCCCLGAYQDKNIFTSTIMPHWQSKAHKELWVLLKLGKLHIGLRFSYQQLYCSSSPLEFFRRRGLLHKLETIDVQQDLHYRPPQQRVANRMDLLMLCVGQTSIFPSWHFDLQLGMKTNEPELCPPQRYIKLRIPYLEQPQSWKRGIKITAAVDLVSLIKIEAILLALWSMSIVILKDITDEHLSPPPTTRTVLLLRICCSWESAWHQPGLPQQRTTHHLREPPRQEPTVRDNSQPALSYAEEQTERTVPDSRQ